MRLSPSCQMLPYVVQSGQQCAHFPRNWQGLEELVQRLGRVHPSTDRGTCGPPQLGQQAIALLMQANLALPRVLQDVMRVCPRRSAVSSYRSLQAWNAASNFATLLRALEATSSGRTDGSALNCRRFRTRLAWTHQSLPPLLGKLVLALSSARHRQPATATKRKQALSRQQKKCLRLEPSNLWRQRHQIKPRPC